MSKRPKLIYRELDYPNFNQAWIRPLVQQHFDLVEWHDGLSVDKEAVILTTFQQDFLPDAWYRGYEVKGNRIVVDHLFDSDVDTGSRKLQEHKFELRSPHWMWYRTALLAHDAGYHRYRPNRMYTHDFLCLMNKVRAHRDLVMYDLEPQLRTARWSYVERGFDIGDPSERAGPIFWEYYMNPQWYDSTCWHFVVESWIRSDAWFNAGWPFYRTEISEKSYKPLAYFQPFVVMGSVDTLKFLRSQGFETFDNLWSEQYDSIPNDQERMTAVLDHVKHLVLSYNQRSPAWDRLTEQKLQHNHARFFDLDTVCERFHREIIGDILEFIEQ